MTEMMAFNWERVDAVVEQMEDELTQARSEFITLCRMVSEWIGHLKKLIIDLDQGGRQRDEAIDDLGHGLKIGPFAFPQAPVLIAIQMNGLNRF